MSLANEMILEPMGEMHDYWLEFNEIEQVKEPEVTVDGHCKAIDGKIALCHCHVQTISFVCFLLTYDLDTVRHSLFSRFFCHSLSID